jgi:NTE family protein
MKVGLMLGGGGVVGIAWELGVMAGLEERAGFDPLAMDVIVGTSAGSVAGAQVALGKPLSELVAHQQRPPRRPTGAASAPAPSGAGLAFIPEEIMQLLMSQNGTVEERAAAIGALAADVPVALSEDDYVESFRTMLGRDQWPAGDLRLTTAECGTGRTVLWTKHDGIDLVRAVASSCAIPGYFPSVSFAGERYIDGPRRDCHGPVVAEKELDGIIFIGPLGALPSGLRLNPEIDQMAADGFPVVQVTGGEALGAVAVNLMDPGARVAAVNVGLDDGRAAADAVIALMT